MNTFILFWNPQISNFKDQQRSQFVKDLRKGLYYEFSWAIWDWQQAQKGDRFFRIQCGMSDPAKDGVIDSGYFTSNPYSDDDWSGRGRKVHYIDMEFDAVIDYNRCPILASDTLDIRIPHFDWHGGHSGRFLDQVSAAELESLWQQHLDTISSNPKTSKYVYIQPVTM